jgi:catechol 2,3-dioxygenase-like lactoylglutathione lyase family enzyme
MTSLPTAEAPVKFHLSLNTANLARSVDFFRALFGTEPAKWHDDYAKFEPAELGLVFSMVPRVPSAGRSMSHIGLRLADPVAVGETRRRLAEAGLAVVGPQAGGFRVTDPDGNRWDVYAAGEEPLPGGANSEGETPAPEASSPGPVVWEHWVVQPPPERIPHADGSVDEVRLTGTFNAALEKSQRELLVRESFRVLRPGGKVLVHGLVADRPFPGSQPSLPGLAALVSRVPLETEALDSLRAAGFAGLQLVKLTEAPWFRHDGVEMREMKLIAWKPAATDGNTRRVVYRGPFRQAVDDTGNVYPRGRSVAVPVGAADLLRRSPAALEFQFDEEG